MSIERLSKGKTNAYVLAPFLTFSPAHFHDSPQWGDMCEWADADERTGIS